MKKKLLAVFIIYIVLAGVILWLGSDRLPKDPVARYMVQKNAGKIRFDGTTRIYYGGGVFYHFILTDYNDPELLATIVQTFNNAIRECDPDYRRFYYGICLWKSYDNLDIKSLVIDISDDTSYIPKKRYDDFQCIEISGLPIDPPEAIYNRAETYLQLKNVKILVVTPEIDKNAKENGIDWYEVWPELEYYEVREMNPVSRIEHPEKKALAVLSVITAMTGIIIWLKREKPPKDPVARYIVQKNADKIRFIGKRDTDTGGATYHFMLADYDDALLLGSIIQTFRDAVKKYTPDKYHGYHRICLDESFAHPGIISTVISISNYNCDKKQLYDDFQHVEIFGFSSEFPDFIYNHAETYLQLEHIKTLIVSPKIDEDARKNGINWYETWQELEHYEIRGQNK